MEKDSGDAPHFLHVKEFVVEFIENTLESGMTAFDPKRPPEPDGVLLGKCL